MTYYGVNPYPLLLGVCESYRTSESCQDPSQSAHHRQLHFIAIDWIQINDIIYRIKPIQNQAAEWNSSLL